MIVKLWRERDQPGTPSAANGFFHKLETSFAAVGICQQGNLSCGDDVHCFNATQRCDTKRDCPNGRDESNCTAGIVGE